MLFSVTNQIVAKKEERSLLKTVLLTQTLDKLC